MTATFKIFMNVSLPCSVHFVYEVESFILCILWWRKQTFFFFIIIIIIRQLLHIYLVDKGL